VGKWLNVLQGDDPPRLIDSVVDVEKSAHSVTYHQTEMLISIPGVAPRQRVGSQSAVDQAEVGIDVIPQPRSNRAVGEDFQALRHTCGVMKDVLGTGR
jgi:hypothetical protein